MNEEKVNHLFKAAALITRSEENKTYNILRSYYLMRCPALTNNNLIDKKRCSHCCLDFTRNDKWKVNSIKLSKKQKWKLKSNNEPNMKDTPSRNNQLEIICTFCGQLNSFTVPKFYNKKEVNNKVNKVTLKSDKIGITNISHQSKAIKHNPRNIKKEEKNNIKQPLNVYTKASEIFSLKNENNKLSTTKEIVQIKNNKKKKDKFAGLCQIAVSAAAKIKENKEKNNKLNLFLKPTV